MLLNVSTRFTIHNYLKISEKIILGTAQLGLNYGINNNIGKPSTEDSIKILKTAGENGIIYLDTAEGYGNAQEVIGMYHQSFQNKFNIITKLHEGSLQIFKNIEGVIKKDCELLHVNTLYGYLFHNINLYKKYFSKNEFKNLKNENKINKVGVSVYTNEEAREVADNDDINIIQLPFNLLDNMNLRGDILQLLKSRGKEVHVRSVFLQGLFFMPPTELPAKLKYFEKYIRIISKIAEQNNILVQHLALMYVLQNKFIDKIIIGIESVSQINEHINLLKNQPILAEGIFHHINSILVSKPDLLNPMNWNN